MLGGTCHWLCCNILSDLLSVVVALWVGFVFSTLGVRAFGMALLIMTLCIGSDHARSVGSITLGRGVSVVGFLFCGGLVVLSKVTCRGSVGTTHNSGIGSNSGALLRMLSSFVNASIYSNPLWFLFPFKACVRSLSALVITSTGIMVGCVMNFVLKNTVSDTLSLFVCFT